MLPYLGTSIDNLFFFRQKIRGQFLIQHRDLWGTDKPMLKSTSVHVDTPNLSNGYNKTSSVFRL